MSIPTPYEDLLRDVMAHGTHKSDRTGTGTTSVFGRQIRFDLAKSFPLITTKRVHFKSVAVELLWFLRGESNVKWMQDQGVTIWNEWADAEGELGPVPRHVAVLADDASRRLGPHEPDPCHPRGDILAESLRIHSALRAHTAIGALIVGWCR